MKTFIQLSILSILAVVSLEGQLALAQTGQPATDARVYTMRPSEFDTYLSDISNEYSDPAARLVAVAEATIGQTYAASPLGEGQYDFHDPKPLFALDRSDAKTFVEQSLAAALSDDFASFFLALQRLRYRDGIVSTATRNHNLVADWVPNARFLEDVTDRCWGGMAWVPLHQIVRRRAFLSERFGLDTAIADEKFIGNFIPRIYIQRSLPDLHRGDIVLLITGGDREQFGSEIGIITRNSTDPEDPVSIIQSISPAVMKQDLGRSIYLDKKVIGFQILRLRPDALQLMVADLVTMRDRLTPPPINQ